MATFFAAGSLCFLIGPFPGYLSLVGPVADAVTFFVGSLLFTAGGALQVWLAAPDRGDAGTGRAAWWTATIQSAGTIFFNITTFRALQTALSDPAYDRLVWRPDAFGSTCFLISGLIAYRASGTTRTAAAACRGRLVAAGRQPPRLPLLRHRRGLRLRRPHDRNDAGSGGRELDHGSRRSLLPGVRRRGPGRWPPVRAKRRPGSSRGMIVQVPVLTIAQDRAADELLGRDPLALLMGMLLDQRMRQRSSCTLAEATS